MTVRKGNILLVLISGVAVIAAITAIYFYLQNQQLQQQVTSQPTQAATPAPNQYVSPSPTAQVDETANWKAYTSSNNNFSLKYPDSYFHYVKENDNTVYFAPSSGSGEAMGGPVGLTKDDIWFTVATFPNSSGSLEKYLSDDTLNRGSTRFFDSSVKSVVTIANTKGHYLRHLDPYGPSQTSQISVLTEKGNTVYVLSITGYGQTTLQSKEKMFQQIISTFKFL